MQIHVGGICAECFICGNRDFAFLRPREEEPGGTLLCDECSAEVSYDDLRSQIGRAALARRAADRLLHRRHGRG